MKSFRNDFGEDRIVPTRGYHLVAAGNTVLVPDDEWDHWDAGGWTPLDERPEPPAPAAAPQDAAPDAAVPAPAAAKTSKAAAAPAAGGSETA